MTFIGSEVPGDNMMITSWWSSEAEFLSWLVYFQPADAFCAIAGTGPICKARGKEWCALGEHGTPHTPKHTESAFLGELGQNNSIRRKILRIASWRGLVGCSRRLIRTSWGVLFFFFLTFSLCFGWFLKASLEIFVASRCLFESDPQPRFFGHSAGHLAFGDFQARKQRCVLPRFHVRR